MAFPLRTLFVAGAPSVNHYSQLQPLSSHYRRSSSSLPSFRGQTIRYNTQPVLCSPLSHVQQVAVQEEEDVKELVCVIGVELASLEEGIRTGVKPLIQCLRLVDLIQRLGIDRYFQEHIKRILKTTYTKWDESYGLDDADASVVAFRLLRLQGYNVSTDFLEKLQDKNGNFPCFFVEKPTQILGMLNLYKCSQIYFPFERAVMEQAMVYASSHLNKALLVKEQSILQTNNLSFEVKFALDYPRIYNLPRLESRRIVRQFCPTNLYERKCLSLARKDLEILQVHHIREMDKINMYVTRDHTYFSEI